MTKQILAFLFCFIRELNPYSPLTFSLPSERELKPFTPPYLHPPPPLRHDYVMARTFHDRTAQTQITRQVRRGRRRAVGASGSAAGKAAFRLLSF